jgi:8-oxo-dGTP pyrophosphatase MutT (NUDIX family)
VTFSGRQQVTDGERRAQEGVFVPEKATVIDTRVAYDGRIFQAVVERVRLPHRHEDSTVEIVRHAGSVVIAAMPAPDTVLLVRQYRHPAAGYLWELPAGSIDPGEDAETAARRECHEELGVIAGTAERLGEAWALPGYCTEYMTFFRMGDLRAPGPGDASAYQDEDEAIETQVFRVEQVRRMVLSGEIKDLKTAAALAFLSEA